MDTSHKNAWLGKLILVILAVAVIASLIYLVIEEITEEQAIANTTPINNVFVDINGDGLTDYVKHADVIINAGTDIANPASVYCEKQGYKLEIRTAPDGSQMGVCVFSNGKECEEWEYYRGECELPQNP